MVLANECQRIGLLVTCGTMTQSDLQGEQIKLNQEPSREGATASSQGKILVSYGESVMWSFGAEECPTWFVSLRLSIMLRP